MSDTPEELYAARWLERGCPDCHGTNNPGCMFPYCPEGGSDDD